MIMYYVLVKRHPFYYLREYFREKNEKEKEIYYDYVFNQIMRPRLGEYESSHPRETALMRRCWNQYKEKRPIMKKIIPELNKFMAQMKS